MAYTEQEARALVIRACRLLVEKNLVARTWGNISARAEDGCFVITPSGRAYETLTEEDLVTVRLEDCKTEGPGKPSSEKGIHAVGYKTRKDVNFIIHTHQFYATALAAEGEHVPFAPCVEYGLPGTDKLRENTEKSVFIYIDYSAFLLEKHGALLLGKDMEDAFRLASELERKAEQLFRSRVELPAVEATEDVTYSEKDCRITFRNAFTAAYAKKHRKLPAYVDDFAQLFGNAVSCVSGAAGFTVKAPGALLRRDGLVICAAPEEDDARAMAAVFTKNCAAALYAAEGKPLSPQDALLQRSVYTLKYSRLKNKK